MPAASPLLTIVIPVSNKWELTRACLESLREHTSGCDFEVVVADNGSTDATASECASLGTSLFLDRFRYLRFDTNLNFGPACNAGARAAQGELLLLLNNDTLLSPGWLPPLLAALHRSPAVGAVGPLLVYPGDPGLGVRVQHLGIVVEPQLHLRHLYEFFPMAHPLVRKKRRVQALTAAALLLPRTLFFACGGFYEAYRNGGEDVDLGVQISRQGLVQHCVAESVVTHLTSQTPGRNAHEEHNARVFKLRCLKDLIPDLSYHAQKDGYEVRLSDALRPYLALPVRRAEVLNRRMAGGFDADLCREMLQREPLWLEGYAMLAGHCEDSGDLRGACAQRFLETRFRPEPKAFGELLRLARLVGEERFRLDAERWFESDRAFREAADLPGTAREVAGYMDTLHVPDMAALYRSWLEERGLAKWGRS